MKKETWTGYGDEEEADETRIEAKLPAREKKTSNQSTQWELTRAGLRKLFCTGSDTD